MSRPPSSLNTRDTSTSPHPSPSPSPSPSHRRSNSKGGGTPSTSTPLVPVHLTSPHRSQATPAHPISPIASPNHGQMNKSPMILPRILTHETTSSQQQQQQQQQQPSSQQLSSPSPQHRLMSYHSSPGPSPTATVPSTSTRSSTFSPTSNSTKQSPLALNLKDIIPPHAQPPQTPSSSTIPMPNLPNTPTVTLTSVPSLPSLSSETGRRNSLPGLSRNTSIERTSSRGQLGVRTRSPSPSPSSHSITVNGVPWSTTSSTSLGLQTEHDWEELDDRISHHPTWRELHRIVRLCSTQSSCEKMVSILEHHGRTLVNASHLRLLLVQKDGFHHTTRPAPLDLHAGILGYVRAKRDCINIINPTSDPRYYAEADGIPEKGDVVATALMCVYVEADVRSDGTGGKDIVAIFQAFKSGHGETFSMRDVKLLFRLGEFAGNMLRNSRSVDRAQAMYNASLQSHRRSAALLDVAKALASETRLDSIVSIIVSQVPELLDSDRCTLFFVDKEREQLIVSKGASKGRRKNLVSWIFGQCNAPELPFPPGSNEIRFSIKNGLAGHVALTGETINIEDAHTDHRFNSKMDKETGYRTRSLLCVPMIDGSGVIIGVVQAINKNPLYPRFDREDETLLRTFAAQAALAVRNSQLFQKTQAALRQSDALLEVTNALSSELKIEALIKIICSKVQSLLKADRCTVFIVDKEKRELYTSESMSHGMGPSLPIENDKTTLISFPMDRGIAGSVATSGQLVNIPDAYKDNRFNKAFDKETGFRTTSILCMAIKNHTGDVLGVLQVMNKKDGDRAVAFSEDDEKLLAAFCAQSAVAITNSQLFTQTEKALNHALADQRNLKFMLSVTKNLFSDMHLTSMIDQMTMQVHHLLKADDCALYLVDEKTKEFYLAKDESDPNIRRYPFNVGIVGTVAATGETVRISTEAHLDPRFHPAVDQRKGKTTHSILCCPIKAELPDDQVKIVGVISVRDEKDRGGFESEEEKLLKVFCAQAAVAIMNSKRFSSIMDQSEFKVSDHSAADYLKGTRGMNLASDDIETFQFKMEDIKMKGAIGTGSYGEVYRAVVRNQVVAVKKLHVRNLKAEQVDAFCKEASLMCQLAHPNVVGFIGAVTEPSNLCIITEFCARGSLADLLLEDAIEMSFQLKLKFALDSAMGMNYLHTSNPVILHRDLKSDNLLVTQDWTIKVADFGLTRFISEKKAMTQVGTPMWMAPEIIMGKKYTEKADVYAFGIILWEILTRQEPYEEKEPMQIVVEVVNDGLRPTIPAEYANSPLVPLMKDAWHTDPEKRPTFAKIVERLQNIIQQVHIDDPHAGGALLPPSTPQTQHHQIQTQEEQDAEAHAARQPQAPATMQAQTQQA